MQETADCDAAKKKGTGSIPGSRRVFAKSIYSITGTKFQPFLKWQVKAILEKGEICVKDEYIKWKLSQDYTEAEIDLWEIDFD